LYEPVCLCVDKCPFGAEECWGIHDAKLRASERMKWPRNKSEKQALSLMASTGSTKKNPIGTIETSAKCVSVPVMIQPQQLTSSVDVAWCDTGFQSEFTLFDAERMQLSDSSDDNKTKEELPLQEMSSYEEMCLYLSHYHIRQDTMYLLKEQELDMHSLSMLNESHMIAIGMKMGPRILLANAIKNIS
jgi:hypothetical protein